jgi:CheY-like chemotaxis protein
MVHEAVEMVKLQHFDLVLLDYFMPGGMTGEEVVKEIRKFNEYIQVYTSDRLFRCGIPRGK